MLVYGDLTWPISAGTELAEIRQAVNEARSGTSADERQRLTSDLLVRVGMFTQAILDLQFCEREMDEATPVTDTCHALLLAVGRMHAGDDTDVEGLLGMLPLLESQHLLPRMPEGLTQYAVYPEQYVLAARTAVLRAEGRVHVLGLRSIGTCLAAAVAGTFGTRAVLYTVRPTGHPFARTLAIGPALEARMLEDKEDADYLIVDEGPGLSGSSFCAALHWLEDHGVGHQQIHLFPSHAGEPGPKVSCENRQRYAGSAKHVQSFERAILSPGPRCAPLADWFEALRGRTTDMRDLSGGQWRALFYSSEGDYPASHVQQERRKYLVSVGQERWLLRFLGLGPHTRELLARARTLAKAGLVPSVGALVHGFTLARWAEGMPSARGGQERPALLDALARYLTLLARDFRVCHERAGASVGALLHMSIINTQELLGQDCAGELERFRAQLPALHARACPVAIDGKLDAHEWLITPDGQAQKTDALDHHVGHDLIGCQDPAWDVAGAVVELELDGGELERLQAAMRDGAGFRVKRAELLFYELAYLAFRAGHAALASSSLAQVAPRESLRMHAAAQRYTGTLRQRLGSLTNGC